MTKTERQALAREVDDIPGDDGWWKSSTGECFQEAAKQMVASGMTGDETVELLGMLYGAVAEEYGG
jgi:hypothetical protein